MHRPTLVFALAMFLSGCGPRVASVVGTWKGIDGWTGTEKTLVLKSDGTYTETFLLTVNGGHNETWLTTGSGSYVYDGTTLKLTEITNAGVRQGDGKTRTHQDRFPITVPAKVKISGDEMTLDYDPGKKYGSPMIETMHRS